MQIPLHLPMAELVSTRRGSSRLIRVACGDWGLPSMKIAALHVTPTMDAQNAPADGHSATWAQSCGSALRDTHARARPNRIRSMAISCKTAERSDACLQKDRLRSSIQNVKSHSRMERPSA